MYPHLKPVLITHNAIMNPMRAQFTR